MIRQVGNHRSHDTDIVNLFSDMRKDFTHGNAAFPVSLELERRRHRHAGDSFGDQVGRIKRCPSRLVSSGFGSNVSTWEAPPLKKIWITRFARGAK